ncbi:MAG: hypothetical protein H7Z37_08445 [Pyrinomonadaceae bacterium]|nr:hypothetical protein [Pyrinomonadaceae bacterium]
MAHAVSMPDESDSNDVEFTVEFPLPPKEPDNAKAVAKAYYAKFGLTDGTIIKQFTLFANQYRKKQVENELTDEANNLRSVALGMLENLPNLFQVGYLRYINGAADDWRGIDVQNRRD